MTISEIAGMKATALVAKEFSKNVCVTIAVQADTIVAEIFGKTYEICNGTIAKIEKAGSKEIRSIYVWIRQNFQRIFDEPREVKSEEPVECKCLEKTGTIYNDPKIRYIQDLLLFKSPAYGLTILGVPHYINQTMTIEDLIKAKRKSMMWAHPDRGGDSGTFAIVEKAYNQLKKIIDRNGGSF